MVLGLGGKKLLSVTIWTAAWQRICFIGMAWRFTSNLLEVLMVAWVIYPALRVLMVRRHPVLELLFSFIMKTFNLSYNSPPSTINNSIIGHTKEICNSSHVSLNFPQHSFMSYLDCRTSWVCAIEPCTFWGH